MSNNNPPVLDHRGQGSFQARQRNYNEQQRVQAVQANTQQTQMNGEIPGPSGRPQRNFVVADSRASSRNIAQSQGHGHKPVHDTAHAQGQNPHNHVTTASGDRGNRNTPHVEYFPHTSSMRSTKKN